MWTEVCLLRRSKQGRLVPFYCSQFRSSENLIWPLKNLRVQIIKNLYLKPNWAKNVGGGGQSHLYLPHPTDIYIYIFFSLKEHRNLLPFPRVSVFSSAKQSRFLFLFLFWFTEQLIIIAVAAIFGAFIGSQRLPRWLLHRSSNAHNSLARELLIDIENKITVTKGEEGEKG